MNHRISPILMAACVALATLSAPSRVLLAEQNHMEKSIELLQKAKTDSKPIALLERARENIRTAKNNKGGRRGDALTTIQEGIQVAKAGGNPEAKINHAIAAIHSGEDRAN